MKRSNNDSQGSNKSTCPKKQTSLGAFLMKNKSNQKPLAKATLKRHILAKLAKKDEAAERERRKALKMFKNQCNIDNAKITREGSQTAMKHGIVTAISEYDIIYSVNKHM